MAFASALKIANTLVSAVATVTSVSIMAFSGYMIYENQYVQNRAYGSRSIEYKPEVKEDSVSINGLLENIPDANGWITMDDTHIDYPVVQGDDDVYYASHDEYKDPSLTGAIYLQAKNLSDYSESYSLLYGHHMDNGAMFGDLSKYIEEDYFKEHLTGTLVTKDGAYDIEVVSLLETDAYEKDIYDRTSLTWEEYQNQIKNNGNIKVINENPNVTDADKFIVLSTCEGNATDGRLVLICKITESGKNVEPTPSPKPDEPTPTPAPDDDKDNKGAVIVKTGDPYDGSGWSILNLCCLLLTITTIMPYISDWAAKKEERKRTLREFAGPLGNIILAVIAIMIFITYENMKLPMIIMDKYTPWMLIILGMALVTEELCSGKKKKEELGEEKADV
jgi:sortase B